MIKMALEIIVMIKQVPDSSEVVIDPVTFTLNRGAARNVINPADENAVEQALLIKDKNPGTHITVITMGPPFAETALLDCMARGVDRAILVTDRAFAGADTYPTGLTLAATITKIGKFDIIYAGEESTDSSTGHVGPGVAEFLGIEQASYTSNSWVEDGSVFAERQLEDGVETVKMEPPCLITVLTNANIPREATLRMKIDALKKGIETWTLADINLKPEWVGLKGSPTIVKSMRTINEKKREGKKFGVDEMDKFVDELVSKEILKFGGE
ncbi:MAG: electron transfer flavoprotein subunit beta/FixA family protein [Candidatus Thermoplasmatota archaeon]|jgi:electron transfer flavoprotein beta subunit|nr:MAG: hypothetical protein AMDU5_GPLC00019G0087 [Thermoplasmatales archaeon Gpl]MCL6014154.1 electron transfer flavoprotein subunit beta/FixA family protein [Candidatus Thermoplasmatota archaeon]